MKIWYTIYLKIKAIIGYLIYSILKLTNLDIIDMNKGVVTN